MTAAATTLPIATGYTSLDDAKASLAEVEQVFREKYDRRAIFASAYLTITEAIASGITAGSFKDGAWVADYALCFANLYRAALLDYETGNRAKLAKSWRIAFDAAAQNRALVIQDLVLGINAHINHDLALALAEVSIDPNRASRYADHVAVNEVLRAAVDTMQERIAGFYAPVLRLLDWAGEHLDEEIACFRVAKARESAWVAAVALANTRDDRERAAINASLDERSAVLARLILAPTFAHPWALNALQHLETMTPWTRLLLRGG